MLRKGLFIAAVLLMTGVVFAQAEVPAEVESPWSGSLSLGFLSTSGNTDTTSYNTTFGVGYVRDRWAHAFNASAHGAENANLKTAEAFQAGWKSEFSISEHDFLFGTIDWRKDRFSGVDQQVTEAIGYGRHLIDTPVHLLSAGLGVGSRQADLADGTSESGVIGRGNVYYTWTFSETTGFEQNIIVESGSDNTYVESVSAVRAKLLGDFALVVSYTIKQNSDVPVGTDKTDKLTAISIEYAF